MSDPHAHDGGDGGHHGSPFIQHHYDDAQHQFDSGKLGIWFFLVQEVLFFSALFVAYILYRNHRPEIFAYAHKYLDVKWGAINTCVLIISSLTAAWSVRCAQLGQRIGLIACISVTILCACGFLGIKYIEYMHKIEFHELFGSKFDPCVSSGGADLLNRGNECPGTKRSECRGGNIAIDPATQLPDCQANELVDHADDRFHQAVDKCGPKAAFDLVVGFDGKVEKGTTDPAVDDCVFRALHDVQVPEDVAKQANAWVVHWDPPTASPAAPSKVVASTRRPLPECVMVSEEGSAPEAKNAPCFEIAQNPWVCKPTEAAALVHYNDEEVRYSDVQIQLTCKDAAAAAPIDLDKPLPKAGGAGQATVLDRHAKTEREEEEEAWMKPPPPHTNMFFSIYFAMTGLHGIHVLVGVFVFIWLLYRAIRGDFTPDYFGPIDYAALYWHLVDLIWIFLFPLLYLIH